MATGKKTGGRQKGTPNAAPASAAAPAAAARAAPPAANILPPRGRGRAREASEPAQTGRGRPRNPVDPGFPKYRMARVATLIPYMNNPRTHSRDQVQRIAASITEFGFTNPVLTDGKRGIVAGHGRLLAAQSLGMETVPIIALSHLTAAQRRAYVIADNKLGLDAGWDADLLELELGALRDAGFDLALTGFDGGELAALFDEPEPLEAAPVRTTTKTVECPSCRHVFAP